MHAKVDLPFVSCPELLKEFWRKVDDNDIEHYAGDYLYPSAEWIGICMFLYRDVLLSMVFLE